MSQLVGLVKRPDIVLVSMQADLLSFVNDAFIDEMLPRITKYMEISRKEEYREMAVKKADELVKCLE